MRKNYLLGRVCAVALVFAATGWAAAAELASVPVQTSSAVRNVAFDGMVEAVKQSAIAAQVAGTVVALEVKAGDTVKAGQLLLRIDPRAAEQTAAASEAQVQVARSALEVAKKEVERQRQLFQKRYISQAALDQAEAQFKATSAQVAAQLAQAGAARTQSGFHAVRAPYAGVVADVPVMQGDMAMPGRPLLTLYDPGALRVTAAVPQSALTRMAAGAPMTLEVPALPPGRRMITPERTQVLPTIDAGTHTAQVRMALPSSVQGLAPGMFARVWLPLQGGAEGRLFVPAQSVVRRAELTAVYVVDDKGRVMLRQVRVGRSADGQVEVLSGVSAGERVALDPQAAARMSRLP